jgi:GTP-binding protein Era
MQKVDPLSQQNNEPKNFKAGFVSVIGRPNVGKSTLMNVILGQKIAAVSPKPQTTRKQQLGILTNEEAQIVFVDTPGIHIARHKLGDYMNKVAESTLSDGDLIMWIVDISVEPTEEDRLIAQKINSLSFHPEVIIIGNKIDLVSSDQNLKNQNLYTNLLPEAKYFSVSASLNLGIKELLDAIIPVLPEGEPFYDEEQITDYYERDIAVELIREAVMRHLEEEVPHAVAVRLDSYEDREDDLAYIMATLFVERDSQKGIVIGKKGVKIKEIGQTARKEIEEMSGRRVFLDLRVKVHKNWRNNPDALNMMGYVLQEGK